MMGLLIQTSFGILMLHSQAIKRLITIVLTVIFCQVLPGQEQQSLQKIDSLLLLIDSTYTDTIQVRLLHQVAQEYRLIDTKSTLRYANRSLDLAESINFSHGIACGLFERGTAYTDLGLYEHGVRDLNRALVLFKQLEDNNYYSRTLLNLGNVFWFTEEYRKAIQYYREAKELNISSAKKDFIPGINMNLGIAYSRLNIFDSAYFYLHTALVDSKENNLENGIGLCYFNLGGLFERMKDYGTSNDYYMKAKEYEDILPIQARSSLYFSLCISELGLKNYQKAKQFLEEGRLKALKSQSAYDMQNYYFTKFKVDSTLGEYSLAINDYQKFKQIEDSIKNENYHKEIAGFQTLYEVEKKDKEIAILKDRDENSQRKVVQQRRMIFLFSSLAFVAIGFIVVVIRLLQTNRRFLKRMNQANKVISRKNTELLQSQEELKALNSTKDKFFSIIAHDLRSPMNYMIGFSDILVEKGKSLPETKRTKYATLLNAASKDLFALLENLLQWSRHQTGRIPYKPEQFYFIEVALLSLELLNPAAMKKNINIVNKVKKKHMVFADFNMINTIFRNIMNNAIKFTGEKGSITINSYELKDCYRIEISDTGIGISQEKRNKLFRIDQSSSRAGTAGESGTGLGLIICHDFVRKNEGEIGVRSEVGEGSTFWFTLKKADISQPENKFSEVID